MTDASPFDHSCHGNHRNFHRSEKHHFLQKSLRLLTLHHRHPYLRGDRPVRVGGYHRLAPLAASRQRRVSGNTLGCAQSLMLTPRASSFFAYASLRLLAFAAVSVADWTAFGPFGAAALINPNLWAASACARLKVAMSSAWARDGFTGTSMSNSVFFCAVSHPAPRKAG